MPGRDCQAHDTQGVFSAIVGGPRSRTLLRHTHLSHLGPPTGFQHSKGLCCAWPTAPELPPQAPCIPRPNPQTAVRACMGRASTRADVVPANPVSPCATSYASGPAFCIPLSPPHAPESLQAHTRGPALGWSPLHCGTLRATWSCSSHHPAHC